MIELQNVKKTYDNGTKALRGVDMHIDDGEFVFLVGPSGSGKSTIIKILTAELRPTAGNVFVNGFKLEKIRQSSVPFMRRTLGVIFQDFRLIDTKSVYENVAFAMRVIGASDQCSRHHRAGGHPRAGPGQPLHQAGGGHQQGKNHQRRNGRVLYL